MHRQKKDTMVECTKISINIFYAYHYKMFD
jgi:hypothetical protein